MSICLLRRDATQGEDEGTNLHFPCRCGASTPSLGGGGQTAAAATPSLPLSFASALDS